MYAEDGALQFDLRVGGVVASIVDDGLVVELEIADVADDEVVVCLGCRCWSMCVSSGVEDGMADACVDR